MNPKINYSILEISNNKSNIVTNNKIKIKVKVFLFIYKKVSVVVLLGIFYKKFNISRFAKYNKFKSPACFKT